MLRPSAAVVPIVENRADGACEAFLGTGVIVAPAGVLVTARHVLTNRPSASTHSIEVVIRGDEVTDPGVSIRRVGRIRLSDTRDVAVAELSDTTGLVQLALSTGRVATNVDVLTFEYSHTRFATDGKGRRNLHFFPATLKGNVVRHYQSDFGLTTGMRCFDTSFPALQGASGAPVLRNSDFAVVGMLVANVERHLLPAQVTRLDEASDLTEETKYFMPFGQALLVDEIIASLSEFDIPVDPALPAA